MFLIPPVTLKGLNLAERLEFSYYIIIEFAKVMPHSWILEFECHISIAFCRIFLDRKVEIQSYYQDHIAQKDFTMVFRALVFMSEINYGNQNKNLILTEVNFNLSKMFCS